jgi:hypothetical protein
VFLAVALPVAAAAQTRPAQPRPATTRPAGPAFAFRPFFVVKGERAAASQTFDAALDSQLLLPFLGGGLQIDLRRNLFIEIAASRFSRTGQRVFLSDGQVLPLGIQLKATVTPIEVTAGRRFPLARRPPPRARVGTPTLPPKVFPYLGAGVGLYRYSETSTFNDAGEDIDASHVGYILVGGVEVRASRWIAVAVDAQYTYVSGILGIAGISKEFGETDLGGTGLRVKVLVGR